MSAFNGTVALISDPNPARLRAFWTFFRAGNVICKIDACFFG
ncbi:hypothetical protein HanRHA438_Chr12g0534561 [Helianthus annuus]|nr:hypothetical protein HanRHA438_Chr12g0534561 [Helianthus annuus]